MQLHIGASETALVLISAIVGSADGVEFVGAIAHRLFTSAVTQESCSVALQNAETFISNFVVGANKLRKFIFRTGRDTKRGDLRLATSFELESLALALHLALVLVGFVIRSANWLILV